MNITDAVKDILVCRNAKPPINHKTKRSEEAVISNDVAEFLAKGGEVKYIEAGTIVKPLTFKQRNDSTYKGQGHEI